MRTAVIGAGRIAEQHLRALEAVEGLEIAVCDLSPAAAEFAAERFRVSRYFTDFGALLREMRPDVVHITTPLNAHVSLARRALEAGAHVLVEKPIAPTYAEWRSLRETAALAQRWIVEDQPYPFSRPVRKVLARIDDGSFGDVVHVEAMISLDIGAPGSVFADRHAPHPSHDQPGGPISDFLTHLASICRAFAGRHTSVRSSWRRGGDGVFDELRTLVETERATAMLGFSGRAQPDSFRVTVHGTRMTASMSLFEGGLMLQRRWPGASALTPLTNGLVGAWSSGAGALRSLVAKLAGRPEGYEGLHELVARFYGALRAGGPPPIGVEQIDDVFRLVEDLTSGILPEERGVERAAERAGRVVV